MEDGGIAAAPSRPPLRRQPSAPTLAQLTPLPRASVSSLQPLDGAPAPWMSMDQRCSLRQCPVVQTQQTPFIPCHYCNRRRYCSMRCAQADWQAGHGAVCERNRLQFMTEADDAPLVEPQRKRRRSKTQSFLRRQRKAMIEHKIKALSERKPYFLSWVIFVQIAVTVAVLLLYPIAEVAFTSKVESSQVPGPNGNLIVASRNSSINLFIGPSTNQLVKLGAKFAPCMRSDELVQQTFIDPIKEEQRNYGCCLRQAGELCFASNAEQCDADYTNTSCRGAICCIDPQDYPFCQTIPEASLPPGEEYDVCRCQVVARPCCYGRYGECMIATEDHCDYIGGTLHDDALTCAEVDCLQDTCSLGTFSTENTPDQWYRFILASFLHVGACHTIAVVTLLCYVAFDIEKVAGWWRTAAIYFISSIGGYVLSAIFTPYQVGVGGSPALYGFLACLLVELVQSWKNVKNPCWQLFKLMTIIVVSLGIGTLPYVNNFSHVGGFLFGLLAGIVFLPWQAFGAWHRARKHLFALIALGCIVALFAVGLPIFFTDQDTECSICEQANCVNYVSDLCEDYGQTFPS